MVAEKTHALLVEAGLNPWLVNLRSLKPLDEALLNELGESCSHLFTFETNAVIGGTGSRIAQLLAAKPCQVVNFGYPDRFIAHGKTEQLNEMIGFTPETLAAGILNRLKA